VYAYLSSFAGSGEVRTAFPSIAKILDDLGVSKDSFYKYRKELEDAGYITVKQEKNDDGTFKNNIYYIEAVPCPKTSETDEPFPKIPDTDFPDTEISDTNKNKSFKSNTLNIKARKKEERADASLPADPFGHLEKEYMLLQEIARRVFGLPRAEQVDTESLWQHWHDRFPQYDLTHFYAVMRAVQRTAGIRDDLTGIIVKRLPNAQKALVPIKMQAIDYIANLRRELARA
jgi:hypothetical protein